MTWAVASRGGHVECMEWLHANGCHWEGQPRTYAEEVGLDH
jgi:hypothetical protein